MLLGWLGANNQTTTLTAYVPYYVAFETYVMVGVVYLHGNLALVLKYVKFQIYKSV